MVATVPSRRRIDPYIHLPRFCTYAELVVRRIVAAVERLHAFPESGRVVPERNVPEIREGIVAPYRVVYRLREGTVEIVTVFRGSREFPEFLG